MHWVLIATGGGALVAGLIAYAQRQTIKRLNAESVTADATIKRLERAIAERDRAIGHRDYIIEEMANASRKAREAHERIRSGSDRDRFDASLDELRDSPGSG